MLVIRQITLGFMLIMQVALSAQSQWDDFANVQKYLTSPDAHLPEVDNYKITIGNNTYTQDDVTAGAWVYYLIHWALAPNQAQNSILIRDTFDLQLDGDSFVMISSSHPYQVDNQGKQILQWNVTDLIFTENSESKEGHVYFKVKINQDVKAPAVIQNTAYLELQNGISIKTTTASIQVLKSSDTDEPTSDSSAKAAIYPNPAHQGTFYIQKALTQGDQVSLFDAFGKSIRISYAQSQVTVTEPYPSGIYYLHTRDQLTGRVTIRPISLIAD